MVWNGLPIIAIRRHCFSGSVVCKAPTFPKLCGAKDNTANLHTCLCVGTWVTPTREWQERVAGDAVSPFYYWNCQFFTRKTGNGNDQKTFLTDSGFIPATFILQFFWSWGTYKHDNKVVQRPEGHGHSKIDRYWMQRLKTMSDPRWSTRT